MASQNLSNNTLVIVAPPPQRFSLDEWYLNNRTKYRYVQDQQQLADRTLTECQRLREKTKELATLNKNDTNHYIQERIKEIEFRRSETVRLRKEACLEIEALEAYNERIMDAMASIKTEALRICKKCIIFREGRLGIDLVHDDVEIELFKEVEVIEGAQALLKRVLDQANEQVRRLRSTIYLLDRDLEDKSNVLIIDKHNAALNENSLSLSMYHGTASLGNSNISAEEWEIVTDETYEKAAKEKNSGVQLRSYVDILLKQIIEDLNNQYEIVNEAFRRRIEETKEAKTKLELQHYETTRQVNEMSRNITQIEKAIAEKEGNMALAHTRLGLRAQRPGLELCRDIVELKLGNEVAQLSGIVCTLQQMMEEAQALLRYLLKTQVQLEEDINIKTNTVQIDEVDCMTLRQSINFHAF